MPALEIEIINKLGLHARASAKFVGVAGQYKDCTIRVGRTPETTVDGKSIMAMMMLAAGKGTSLHLQVLDGTLVSLRYRPDIPRSANRPL